MLLERAWELHFDPRKTMVGTHLRRLRSKVDRGHGVALTRTVLRAGQVAEGGLGRLVNEREKFPGLQGALDFGLRDH